MMKKFLRILSWVIPILTLVFLLAKDTLEPLGISAESVIMGAVFVSTITGMALSWCRWGEVLGNRKLSVVIPWTTAAAVAALSLLFGKQEKIDIMMLLFFLSEGFVLYLIEDLLVSGEHTEAKPQPLPKSDAPNCVVICKRSFAEPAAYPFKTNTVAKVCLKQLFEEEVRINREEKGNDITAELLPDGMSAHITVRHEDGDEEFEWFIASIYE